MLIIKQRSHGDLPWLPKQTEKNIYELFVIVRMHFVHKSLRTLRPFAKTVTFCRLGRNVRLVARKEKLRLCPKVVVLPHASHFAMAN
jgi:hypothetical protein